ncbi:hypothetical protein A3B87_02055 [Candidatus Kuenenbacteria bacterium RIFCSPHIGHO2_02_FULL_39_13]|uniref:Uncharacterized protein n=1 Tax=Candidatus Kuenenbacteria bacterium RIFCSPHIGHO2_02_FULL_39_13 TaxID=1798561 RepID=A0A1F6FL73_9BACT|nr:MAG: hypothetical protein A3B87_02055 [Candidatus Kuenenbacteria bacterium RIFCSPHIGHO2_02_FULL_39_13]
MLNNLNNNKKNTGTKLMFGVLVFFGISTLILGVLQITKTINIGGPGAISSGQDLLSNSDNLEPSIAELQSSDTDNDGLSDFDELYIYSTSPYLTDSDSDGYDDKTEIDGGFDPNCPKGQDCRSSSAPEGTTEDKGTAGTEPADNSATSSQTVTEQITPQQIREFILGSGQMTAEQLKQIDDETLIEIWNQAVEQSEGE